MLELCTAEGLEKLSVSVFLHCEEGEKEAKAAGKLIVDAKVKVKEG